MTSHMTLGRKLGTGFASMLILTVLVGIAALSGISSLSHRFDVAVGVTVRKNDLIGSIRTASSDMLAGQRGVVMFTYAKLPENSDRAKRLVASATDRWSAGLAELKSLPMTPEGARLTGQLESSISSWR